MARPVSVVTSGAPPFVSVSSGAPIATPVADGKGPPITLVSSGAPPIVLLSDDGTALAGLSWAPDASYAWDFITNEARFAGNYEGALSNTPNWTFTRASTAYYTNSAGVLIPFGSGVLRTGDRGALIEGAGTNLCLQSQTFDNASWAKNAVTLSADAIAAPDGTTTADKIISDSGALTLPNVSQVPSLSDSTNYTGSVYAKAGEWSWLFIVLRTKDSTTETAAYFNLSTGEVGTTDAGVTARITALANGWYRCEATKNSGTGASSPRFRVGITTADATPNPTGDGTSGIYLWGAQLEATAYASSYIPTTTASATRAADSLTVTGVTGLDYPLTLFAEFERAVDTGAPEGLIQVDTATNDRAVLTVSSGDLGQLYVQDGGVDQVIALAAGAMAVGTVYKAAARISLNDSIVARGGTLSAQDTSCTMPDAPTSIRLGNQNGVSSPLFGYLRRAALFSRALSDGELQALTT